MELGLGWYGFQIAEGTVALAELAVPDLASAILGIEVPAAGGEWGDTSVALGYESGIWTGPLTDLTTGYCYIIISRGFEEMRFPAQARPIPREVPPCFDVDGDGIPILAPTVQALRG